MCVCVRACVRACVRVCVCACVRACVCCMHTVSIYIYMYVWEGCVFEEERAKVMCCSKDN